MRSKKCSAAVSAQERIRRRSRALDLLGNRIRADRRGAGSAQHGKEISIPGAESRQFSRGRDIDGVDRVGSIDNHVRACDDIGFAPGIGRRDHPVDSAYPIGRDG